MHEIFQNLVFCNAFNLNNGKKLWSTSIFKFERKVHIWDTLMSVAFKVKGASIYNIQISDGLKFRTLVKWNNAQNCEKGIKNSPKIRISVIDVS